MQSSLMYYILMKKSPESPNKCPWPTTMNGAELIRQLEMAGWVLRSVKGSHHVYVHPQRGGRLSVPHPKKDLGTGLVHKLMKQAGLK